MVVLWDDGRYEGMVVDRSVVINEEKERLLNTDDLGDVQPTHLLMYDDGDMTRVVVKAGGWLGEEDGGTGRREGVCGVIH